MNCRGIGALANPTTSYGAIVKDFILCMWYLGYSIFNFTTWDELVHLPIHQQVMAQLSRTLFFVCGILDILFLIFIFPIFSNLNDKKSTFFS